MLRFFDLDRIRRRKWLVSSEIWKETTSSGDVPRAKLAEKASGRAKSARRWARANSGRKLSARPGIRSAWTRRAKENAAPARMGSHVREIGTSIQNVRIGGVEQWPVETLAPSGRG